MVAVRNEKTAAVDKVCARIVLRADRVVGYGEVMAVMNALRSAGCRKVAPVGRQEQETK